LTSLLPSGHTPALPRLTATAAEGGCSPPMACRGWHCSEFSPTSSPTLSPTSLRDVVTNGRARPRKLGNVCLLAAEFAVERLPWIGRNAVARLWVYLRLVFRLNLHWVCLRPLAMVTPMGKYLKLGVLAGTFCFVPVRVAT